MGLGYVRRECEVVKVWYVEEKAYNFISGGRIVIEIVKLRCGNRVDNKKLK